MRYPWLSCGLTERETVRDRQSEREREREKDTQSEREREKDIQSEIEREKKTWSGVFVAQFFGLFHQRERVCD